MVKYLPTNAGDTGYTGLIPVQEDILKKEMTNHSSILAQEIPRTEEPGGVVSRVAKESDTTK